MFFGDFSDSVRFLLSQINLRDVFDLLLVWFLVYRVLLLTKKSGAVQILSGMGVVALLYFISIAGEFATFNRLLETVFSNLFLIVIILFQSELRRALAQIGSNPFLFGGGSAEVRHNLEEIAHAATKIAEKGWGALIVIEREIVLDYFVEQGTEMDAAITSELLSAIFAPTSSVHDGAVIVRNNRIFTAGTFLPLSQNPTIDKQWGTRHRAAMGVSEQTDAIVIAVSEETRSVGIFHGGHYTQNLSQLELRNELYNLMGMKPRVEKGANEETHSSHT